MLYCEILPIVTVLDSSGSIILSFGGTRYYLYHSVLQLIAFNELYILSTSSSPYWLF